MKKHLRWIFATICILFVAGVVTLVFLVNIISRQFEEWEHNLSSGYFLAWTISAYTEDNQGKWPQKWEDLRETKLKYDDWSFAEYEQEVKEKFTINFDTSVEQIAAEQTWGIKPVGEGHYDFAQEYINFRLKESLTDD